MNKNKNGFTLIYAVLIISVIIMVSIISYSGKSANSVEAGRGIVNKKISEYVAKSCLEKSLMEIRKDSNFSGNGSFNVSDKSCDYEIINQGNETKTIRILTNISGNISRFECLIDQINPQINISSLKELNSFN